MKIMSRIALLLAIVSFTSCISMIHRSVDRNDVAGVREEVNAGVPVESTDYRDKTPLLMAAEQGHMEIVRYLVEEANADVNATTPESRGEITPLRYAISNEDYEMVRFLVENGADVNQANGSGWTPIMTAARVGNREILQYLLDEGADVRARTDDGTTPVRVASNNGWTDIVVWMTMLLEQEES
ncbi:MAG: ankyrin repeat domain-containing protein [Alkalispirochaeta sp.]